MNSKQPRETHEKGSLAKRTNAASSQRREHCIPKLLPIVNVKAQAEPSEIVRLEPCTQRVFIQDGREQHRNNCCYPDAPAMLPLQCVQPATVSQEREHEPACDSAGSAAGWEHHRRPQPFHQ